MDGPDYEYRGLIAEYWDLLRGDSAGWADRPFYRAAIERTAALGLRPNLYQQAMEELELPRAYGTIFVPSSSFQLLVDPAAATDGTPRRRRSRSSRRPASSTCGCRAA